MTRIMFAITECTGKYLLFPRIQRHMNYNACCWRDANRCYQYNMRLKPFSIDSYEKNIIVGHRQIVLRSNLT